MAELLNSIKAFGEKTTGEKIEGDTLFETMKDMGEKMTGKEIKGKNLIDVIDETTEGYEGGGGTKVVANPTLEGTEPDLTGLEVDGQKFKVPEVKAYTAGNGISISEDDSVSVDTTVVQKKLTAGNGIAISEGGIISLDIAVADKEAF